MTRVTVLGLGAMGVRMARRLVASGHQVTAWNRTAPAGEAVPGAAIAAGISFDRKT